MAKCSLPTLEELRQLLEYDAKTGVLFWKRRTPDMFSSQKYGNERACAIWNTRFAGKEALGSKSRGYKRGAIKGIGVRAHVVAWMLYYGARPNDQIDHINGDSFDNRIENLRDVTNAENGKNQKRSHRNTSGVTGVSWCRSRNLWQSYITVDQKRLPLGRFEDFSDAVATRKMAERAYCFHENHGRN